MKAKRFIVKPFEYDSDFLGLVSIDFPNFEPATDLGVSHDLLEHPPINYITTNPLCNEFMALGGTIFTRIEYHIPNSMIRHDAAWLGRAIVSLVVDEVFGYEYDSETPKTNYLENAPKTRKTQSSYVNGIINEAIEYSLTWCAELSNEQDENDEHFLALAYIKKFYNDIISWLRLGYSYAKRRFYRNEQYDVCRMMDIIAKRINYMFGQNFVVENNIVDISFNINTRQVYIKINGNPLNK